MTKVTEAKLSDLMPDQDNANLGTERGLRMLADSLRQYGAGRSILVDKHGRVLAGNKTLEQAVDIGLEDVILVQTNGRQLVAVQRMDLDLEMDPVARQLAYADNRVSQVNLDFDAEQVLADLGAGVDLSGLWDKGELDELLKGIAQEPPEDPGPQIDRAAELQEKWGTATGQIWQLGEHRLAVGDCTDKAVVEAVMREERAEAVMTDPPYGKRLDTDYSPISKQWKDQVHFCESRQYDPVIGDEIDFDPHHLLEIFPKGEMFLWGGDYYADKLPLGGSWIIWDKTEHHSQEIVGSEFEVCWSRIPHRRQIIPFKWAGAMGLQSQDVKRRLHPTQKPLEVIEWILERYTECDQPIWDGYVGSGTTLIACERLNRRCRAIEIEPKYCAVTIQRWADLTGGEPELIES